jgi:hypothetical protein
MRLLVGSVGCALLAACPHHAPPDPPSVVVVHDPQQGAGSSPLAGALDGVGMTLLLPMERQQEEIKVLQNSISRTDLASDRLQLALLLALTDEPIRDTARAGALLAGRSWTDTGSETLARLVLELVEERGAHARDRLDAAEVVDQERRLRRALEERIAAMKAIDTEIDARELGAEAADDGQTEDPVR